MAINKSFLKVVKIHQHAKFQAIPSMRSPGNARKPQIWPVSLRQNSAKITKINRPWPRPKQFWRRSPGNARKRTCCKTVTVGRVDQRTHVQVKRGYFRLRTDGQPKNIMPPAPKGGGIKTSEFGVLYAKGVFVFIYKEWWIQLAKYPSVSWRVLSITIR